MKKLYNTCFILAFVFIYATSTAQTNPYFYFKKRPYYKNLEKDFLKSLKENEIKLPENKRLEIAKRVLKQGNIKQLAYYRAKMLTKEGNDEGYVSYPRYWVLDLNQDKKPDIVMLYNTYFGPSPGYIYLFRKRNGLYEYMLDGMGEIYIISSNKKRTVIQHDLGQIDNTESEIIRTIDINHQKQTFQLNPKLYYASETVFPKEINKQPRVIKIKRETALRFSPEVLDTIIKKAEPGGYVPESTKTLKGNCIARYKANAQAYLLASQGKWAFVAFLPKTLLIKTSLRHGMDEDFDEKTGKIKGPKVKPYICGWIPKKMIK